MSDFSCPIVRLTNVAPVHDADRIELARVFNIDVIVPAGHFHSGDLAIYLPPDAVLPDDLAASMKGRAKLFGERRNRVRPYRLRAAVSEGLLIGPLHQGIEGQDAATALRVTKYEQPVPTPWRGECVHLPGLTVSYDIRSARRYPHIIEDDEEIELTEKLHGTMCAVSYVPGLRHADLLGGDTLIYSKGLSQTGHALKVSNESNLYVRTTIDRCLRPALRAAFNNRPVTAFGEIYGGTIQDLAYGHAEPTFALFDIYLGLPSKGHWLSRDEFAHIAGEIAPRVPTLYRGPLRNGVVQQLASGATVAGQLSHMREGVVIRPMRERESRIGRAILKYVSTEYLTRANGTEFN